MILTVTRCQNILQIPDFTNDSIFESTSTKSVPAAFWGVSWVYIHNVDTHR